MTVTISGTSGFSANAAGFLVGQVCWFAMTATPSGFLQANGAAVSRTTYSALFTAIGTTFGAGDGSTTFNVPDMRGYFARGYDNGRGVDPARAFGSTQADGFGSHTHAITDPGHAHTVNIRVGTSGGVYGLLDTGNSGSSGNPTTLSASTGITNQSTGGTETKPKNVALLGCIFTGV